MTKYMLTDRDLEILNSGVGMTDPVQFETYVQNVKRLVNDLRQEEAAQNEHIQRLEAELTETQAILRETKSTVAAAIRQPAVDRVCLLRKAVGPIEKY